MPTNVRLDDIILQPFQDQMRGAVLTPGSADYEDARAVWNGRFDRRPAAIARCTGAADVIAAVNFARELDLLISVKGGGHSYAGKAACDDDLMIDLSRMKGIWIDPGAKKARVQAGATWGAFDHEAQVFGLATTGGTVSTVGVAGLTLGGGSGYLVRKHGLTIDNLISADVVTAEGKFIRVSEDEHPDLFWALRGGGGNFGIVTSFEYRLHEVGPAVLAGQIVYPADQAAGVLQLYRTFMSNAPDEIQCYAFLLRVPPLPAFPERYHGKVALDLVVCYAGVIAEGEGILQPLRDFGDPMLDTVQPMQYTALQQTFDAGLPKGQRYYSKAHYLNGLSDEVITTVLRHAEALAGPYTVAYFAPESGAVRRVDPASTAFPHRGAAYGFHILAGWTSPSKDNEIIGWVKGFYEALTPYADGGVYVNLLSEDEDGRIRAAYSTNYHRLTLLKSKWDPDNLFRMNHNIPPAV